MSFKLSPSTLNLLNESPRDFCTDTDRGFVMSVAGVASGEDNSVQFTLTDFCVDSATLTEYYCAGKSGDYNPLSITSPCTNSTACVNGACV